ncbi:putative lipid II flippase FtsW [Piscinibacter sp. Jin2]|uniref:Probable peptidoglycan glycosyltransferase FtsW n=1 Tax=Aquariibacter lacus TaxID=2801332 RepID=A0A9X0XF69_9BURK|nr:putative lipid II flippase FtsW [Piscinibacter lacus]MBL0720835.1 putative lipid II flippase FtsW [Piscinibacter lacus]
MKSLLAALQARLAAWREALRARRSAGREGQGLLPVRDSLHGGSAPGPAAGLDTALIGVVLGLMLLGLVMVYSASIALPDSPKYEGYKPYHFLLRHSLQLLLALMAGLLAAQLPVSAWERAAPWFFLVALLLLVLVLIPGIGKVVNNARRWIPLGVINFQPSELAKLAIALYAASYMTRKMDVKEKFFRAVWPMAVALAVTGVLLLREPDMGAFMVIAVIAMGVLFLGGVNGRMFLLSAAVLVLSFVAVIASSEEKSARIFAYLRPWEPTHAAGKAYQLTQSLIAFGRGELFGQGLGDSLEKQHYLPEPHTDFLLAVIGEELGFVGLVAVMLAFFWMVRRCFVIGRQSIVLDRVFAGLYCQGIGLWLGGQGIINMGVNLGALPTKGLTLPLMSYGGSALVMNAIALAIVLRVDAENRQLMRGGRA